MMNEFGDDLVERSLVMLGEETDEIWAASRKTRLDGFHRQSQDRCRGAGPH